MRKVALWEFLTLNTYFFGLSFMWNGLHLILLPTILLLYVAEDQKNTILGLLTASGLVIAMIIQPIAGAVSDRWASRWGRRRPLILAGTLGDFIFLGAMALAGGVPGLAIGYIGLQFTSNSAHGPVQGLLPDRVPPVQLGRGSAIKSALDMLGLIVASLFMGRFLQKDGSNWFAAVAIVMAVLAFTAFVTLAGAREEYSRRQAPAAPVMGRLKEMFRVQWSTAPGFGWLILSRFVFLAGVYGIQAFALYFIRDTLNVPDPGKLTGDLLAAIAISLMVCAFGTGWLCDRFGRKPVHVLAAALVAGGSLLMLLAHTPEAVLVCGSIIGAGTGVFITSNWTLATDLAPQAEAGKFLGLTNLATAGAGAFSRMSGPVLDLVNSRCPGEYLRYPITFLAGAFSRMAEPVLDLVNPWCPGGHIGYSLLFVSSAVFALLALVVLTRVPEVFRRNSAPPSP